MVENTSPQDSRLKIEYGARSDIGMRRKQNQDSLGVFSDLGLFVVADGMGGHRGGEIASQLAVQKIEAVLRERLKTAATRETIRRSLEEAIQDASRGIHQHANTHRELQGMGTTVTVLLIRGGRLYVGHVGDSRCYYVQNDSIWQITKDHSLVQEKLRAGLITRDQMRTDLMRNVITRSVGYETRVVVDLFEKELETGDTFLVCSDGLSGPVDEPMALQILQDGKKNQLSWQDQVETLITTANANGGDDNITAIVIHVESV